MSQNTDTEPLKSSAEILSELFSSFNALPPILKDKVLKKHKKSKKKHKHKDKKHKKKSKHKYSSDSSDDSSDKSNRHSKKRIKKESLSNEENLNTTSPKSPIYDPIAIIKSEPTNKEYEKYESDTSILPPSIIEISEESNVKSEHDEDKCIGDENVTETPDKSTDKETTSDKPVSGKITIKSLKNSTVYEATIKEIEDKAREKAAKFEDGEVTTESEDDIEDSSPANIESKLVENIPEKNEKKRKHSHRDKNSRERSKHDDSKKHKKEKHKKRSRSRSKDRDRHSSRRDKSDYYYSSSRSHKDKEFSSYDRDRYKDRYRDEKRSRDSRRSRSRENRRSRSRDDRRSRDRFQVNSHKDRNHRSDRKRRSKSPSSAIDKKKLLEIARKNAINMLKSGTLPEALTLGPQAQEKVIAAIKAGGKTIEELTDFCKNLSKKEELGELSSVSSNEEEMDSNSEGEKVFHHPFQLKEKPTSIVMNIKNATPLPVKTPKEKSAELRIQFPVSSGQLHRKTENEWVPVSPKKPEPVAIAPLPIAPPPVPEPVPKPVVVTPAPVISILPAVQPPKQPDVDISSIVSQRLNAMRKLQENPNDVQALNQMYKVQKEMQSWAASKQQIGQFTGSTGAQILTPAELSSGYQAWARKVPNELLANLQAQTISCRLRDGFCGCEAELADQLQNAAPVTGGMGMHLLQKMGWKPGEGLGKEKTGSLEPLLLEVKLDKKGLVANEEVKNKKPVKMQKNPVTTKTLAGKHPVSLLGEFATKRKLGVPQYECCFECGPDHKKNFLFKVILNGTEYKPNVASSTKKQAKADAASVCLQQLGLIIN